MSGRSVARGVLGLLLFVATAFVVGEAVVRLGRVEPRVVIVRPGEGVDVHALGDRVVWEQRERRAPGTPDRIHAACATAPGHRLHLYGDSIAFGAGLDADESLGPRLEAALGDRPEPWCVQTFAQPAATLWPELAFAEAEVPASRPDVVVLQLWYGSPRVPAVLDGTVYYLDQLATDVDGYPTFAGGLTGGWHHRLFDASRFWAWLTFAVNPGCRDCAPSWDDLVAGDLARLHALVTAHGGRLVLALAPPLDRPFPAQRAAPVAWYDPAIAWAADHGVPVVRFEDLLADVDVAEVRRNTCCHYDADGAALLGDRLARWLDPVLADAEASR